MKAWLLPGLVTLCLLLASQAIGQTLTISANDNSHLSLLDEASCGSKVVFEEELLKSPVAPAQLAAMEWLISNHQIEELPSNYRVAGLTIPVVVHLVYAPSSNPISTLQVNLALQNLNAAFANSGFYSDPDGVGTGIDFCLAQRDPAGQPSTGINLVSSNLSNFVRESQGQQLKSLSVWPSDQYLNIWVVNEINSSSMGPGIRAYATAPFMHGSVNDGIVIEKNFFGLTPNRSKVLVHEVGHYLGLYHTFEGGCQNNNCLTDGDKVCDTPPDGSAAAANGLVNSCHTDTDDISPQNPFRPFQNGGIGEQFDQIQNFMDHGLLAVLSRFTPGQKTRMEDHLYNFRQSLLNTQACSPPSCLNPALAQFTLPSTNLTIGANLTFTNTSTGATSYTWFVDGNPFSNATHLNTTFTSTGLHQVTLVASNSQAACDVSYSQDIVIECNVQATILASATQVLPGQTVSFASASFTASDWEWFVDGTLIDSASYTSHVFNVPGGHEVQLLASSGTCWDTSAISYVDVGGCGQATHTFNWLFGDSCHLNFNTLHPDVQNTSAMSADEGCTSMTDYNGDLMFYSNGEVVWDKNHQVMPNGNGLMGSKSSSQGVITFPMPGNSHQFLLVTTDAIEYSFFKGLRYSVIDMNLNGGLGDVVAAQKNVFLASTNSEMISACLHENGTDYWLVTHGAYTNQFKSFLVTASGINHTPVISAVGPAIILATGALKISPNRSKLAISSNSYTSKSLTICDFDCATGLINNPIVVPHSTTNQVYGIEFSHDNARLYYSSLYSLYQIDMSQGTPSAIINSNTLIFTSSALRMLGMQRAPDGKIYIASGYYDKLHTIEFPTLLAASCNFLWESFTVSSQDVKWGLPNFCVGIPTIAGKVEISGQDTTCNGSAPLLYQVQTFDSTDIVQWDVIGDANYTLQNSDLELSVNSTGMVDICVSRISNCGITRDTQRVYVLAKPFIDLGDDTLICPGNTLSLSNPNQASSQTWSDNSTGSSLLVGTSGTYSIQVTDTLGCESTDTIIVDVSPAPAINLNLGQDTSICEGGVLALQPAFDPDFQYRWQDGSENPVYTAFQAGTFTVEVRNSCGDIAIDTILVTNSSLFSVDLGPDQMICPGDTLEIVPGVDFALKQWQDGSGSDTYLATQPGTYWLEVTNSAGCTSRDSIVLFPCVVGVDQWALAADLVVYPNPNHGCFQLSFTGWEEAGEIEIKVANSLGQVVFSQETEIWNTSSKCDFNLSELSAGWYFLQVKSGKFSHVRKVQIMR